MNIKPGVYLSIFISFLICQSFLCKAETDTKDANTKITNLEEKTSQLEGKPPTKLDGIASKTGAPTKGHILFFHNQAQYIH